MGNLFSSLKRRIRARRAVRRRRNTRNFTVYRDGLLVEVTEKHLLEDSTKFSPGRKDKLTDSKKYWKSPYANKAHIQPIVYSISVNRDLGIGEITSLCHRFRCEDDETLYENEDNDADESSPGPSDRLNSQAAGPSNMLKLQAAGPSVRLNSLAAGPSDRLNSQAAGPSNRLKLQAAGPSDGLNSQAAAPSDRLKLQAAGPSDGLKLQAAGPSDGLNSQAAAPSDRLKLQAAGPSDRLNSQAAAPSDRLKLQAAGPSDRLSSQAAGVVINAVDNTSPLTDENDDGRPGSSRETTPDGPSTESNSEDDEYIKSENLETSKPQNSQSSVYVTVDGDDVEVKSFPDFVAPFLNRDIRIRLKFHKAVHSTFQQTFSKYEPVHLWRHVKFIDARFLCHPLQNRIKIMLEESHGNRRKPFGPSRRSRPLFPRAIIVNTAQETPGLYVAGKEFSILLGPPPGGARLLDDGRTLYALGTYVRYLDTDRNYLMIWRATIVETAAE